MNNKAIALFMLSGALLGGAIVHTAMTSRADKLKHDLANTKINLRVTNRWLETAIEQMSLEQLYTLMESATLKANFDAIVKDI